MKSFILTSLFALLSASFLMGQVGDYPFTIHLLQDDTECVPGEPCEILFGGPMAFEMRTVNPNSGTVYGAKKITMIVSNQMNSHSAPEFPMTFDPATGLSSYTVLGGTVPNNSTVTFIFEDLFKQRGKKVKKISVPLSARAIKINAHQAK